MGTARSLLVTLLICLLSTAACTKSGNAQRIQLTFPTSRVGAEADVLIEQIARFEALHPEIDVVPQPTPDAADQRHQLYVQWLNARAPDPDILQLDVVWTAEFAAAGWLLSLDRFAPDLSDFFPATVTAAHYGETLYTLPWFVDVGLLYYRKDLVHKPPTTLEELKRLALLHQKTPRPRYGLVWQNARYEGLVTVYLEVLSAYGGQILDDQGRVGLDSEPAFLALEFMTAAINADGFVPRTALALQEEQSRLIFEAGDAVFMRNWPYAYPLLQSEASPVRNQVGVALMPGGPGGDGAATLGGSQLAINARTLHPEAAFRLIGFLTEEKQMLERALVAGQLPARKSLYNNTALTRRLALPVDTLKQAIANAVVRPRTPIYTELSGILQVHLHRALAAQVAPRTALRNAAAEFRQVLSASGLTGAQAKREPQATPPQATPPQATPSPAKRARTSPKRWLWGALLLIALLTLLGWSRRSARQASASPPRSRDRTNEQRANQIDAKAGSFSALVRSWALKFPSLQRTRRATPSPLMKAERRTAWLLVAPTLAVLIAIAMGPLVWTFWDSLHHHDLRMPWLGVPFVGLQNYFALFSSSRFWQALSHTGFFVLTSVGLELVFGVTVALFLFRVTRGGTLLKTVALLPWAMPTVVAALVFRFLFQGESSLVNWVLVSFGAAQSPLGFLTHNNYVWLPLILADVWKTTPFVALLVLSGLHQIPPGLTDAAKMDGASGLRQFWYITLPLLRPTLLVVLVFRTLDALRVFDLVYVLTGGGPGTRTEPLALLTFDMALKNLRFGMGAALSVVIFVCSFGLALVYVRLLDRSEDAR